MKSDLEISRNAKVERIEEIARMLGFSEEDIIKYGDYIAKIKLSVWNRIKNNRNGKYVVVTGITPTPLGEGKTTTTIGLGQALNRLGKRGVVCIRQPTLGPVFGIKGGAHGGGYAQIYPLTEFDLHFTGDSYAVYTAHNLLSSYIDNHLYRKNKLGFDVSKITWRRVIDLSDRSLRHVVIGLRGDGFTRETGFDITSASEVMAILALSKNLKELREKLGKIVVGFTYDNRPITAEDLKVAGSMAVLTKDALMPNLIQTIERTPVFVHTGPFGNIAHGNSSIIADLFAIKTGDFVVTEAGFGADLGAEKFFNIKCRYSGLTPDAAVLVVTVRALKMHGGVGRIVPGKPLPPEILEENIEAVKRGSENMIKQIENIKIHGVPVVVAINLFPDDHDSEVELIRKIAIDSGAEDAVISEVFSKGGEGGIDLAKAVIKASEKGSNFKFLYPLEASIEEKIERIAVKIYGAKKVSYSKRARRKIKLFSSLGYDKLPICMAKTHLSLSHDPNLKGRPKDFDFPIEDIRLSSGAGFLVPLAGDIRTMPGLPSVPSGNFIDIDDDGNIVGLH